jgi:hypothetical protein
MLLYRSCLLCYSVKMKSNCERNTQRVREWRFRTRKPCPDCGRKILRESLRCGRCSKVARGLDFYATKTIGEYRKILSIRGRHPSWLHAHIRGMARTAHQKIARGSCMRCRYDKHVEICHVVPLSKWPNTATIAAINSVENILGLCPNCHWEFDHGFFKAPVAQKD